MRILHTADWHLDSTLSSVYPEEIAKKRRAELCDGFCRMVELAKELDINAVLIAGDLFDTKRVLVRTAERLRAAIADAPDIDFYYIAGNHDIDARFGQELPNLHRFTREFSRYTLGDGIALYGAEAPDARAYRDLYPDENETNLLLLHGELSETAYGEDKVNVRALKRKGFDYLALGHYHSYETGTIDERLTYAYPGCPEGRGFDECGEKGVILLTVEKGSVEHRFIPFAVRTLHTLTPPLSDDLAESERAVSDMLAKIPRSDIVRLTVPRDGVISPLHAKELLGDRFFYSEVKTARSGAVADAREYADEISLRGEFVRLVLASALPDDEKDDVLRYGLSALIGEEGDGV